MDIEVPYQEGSKTIHVDDERLSWVISPNNPPPKGTDAILEALDNPIGSTSMEKLANNADNGVLLVDDNTRKTPQKEILPIVLDRLNEYGLKDDDIKIIVGLGTHRKMTQEEIEERFEVTDRVEIKNHECEDKDQLVKTKSDEGHPLYVNEEYYKADLSIAIGSILPHILTGWSGGSKMVQPGVSGEETTGYTHMMAVRKGVGRSLGEAKNPVREEIDRIALETGLDLILNTILNLDGKIYEAVFGQPTEAFQEGVKFAKDVYSVEIPEIPDIVIANSYPNERNLWQGQKAMNDAYILTEGESEIIFLSPCPEGVSDEHSILLEKAGISIMEVLEAIENGEIEDEVGASGLLSLETLKSDTSGVFVTEGISKEEAKKMGFDYADSVEEALDDRDGKVGILTHSGEMAPKIKNG